MCVDSYWFTTFTFQHHLHNSTILTTTYKSLHHACTTITYVKYSLCFRNSITHHILVPCLITAAQQSHKRCCSRVIDISMQLCICHNTFVNTYIYTSSLSAVSRPKNFCGKPLAWNWTSLSSLTTNTQIIKLDIIQTVQTSNKADMLCS